MAEPLILNPARIDAERARLGASFHSAALNTTDANQRHMATLMGILERRSSPGLAALFGNDSAMRFLTTSRASLLSLEGMRDQFLGAHRDVPMDEVRALRRLYTRRYNPENIGPDHPGGIQQAYDALITEYNFPSSIVLGTDGRTVPLRDAVRDAGVRAMLLEHYHKIDSDLSKSPEERAEARQALGGLRVLFFLSQAEDTALERLGDPPRGRRVTPEVQGPGALGRALEAGRYFWRSLPSSFGETEDLARSFARQVSAAFNHVAPPPDPPERTTTIARSVSVPPVVPPQNSVLKDANHLADATDALIAAETERLKAEAERQATGSPKDSTPTPFAGF